MVPGSNIAETARSQLIDGVRAVVRVLAQVRGTMCLERFPADYVERAVRLITGKARVQRGCAPPRPFAIVC